MNSDFSDQRQSSDQAQSFQNKNVIKPVSGQKEITKIIAVSSDKVLPADAAQAVYASGFPVTLKETCYGLVLTGTEENVNAVVQIVQNLDKNHIFVKDRGFPAGDPRRCRAIRSGGQRPGFYTLHAEISKMGTVGDALDNYEAGVEKTEAEWPSRPSSFKIEGYIADEFGKSKKKPEMAKIIADRIAAKKGAAQSESKTKAKKTAEKAETSKKTTAKKATSEKANAKKTSAEKPAAKTKIAEKPSAKKAAAEKSTAQKTTAKKNNGRTSN
ncbi:MAG: methanogenesis marker 6 protein [Methanosarcinales archaeon]|nr:methanogenesis marker 6 protein [Methanosarcinales archaeon]